MARDYPPARRNWRSDQDRSNRWRDENEGRYASSADDRDLDYEEGGGDQGRVRFGRDTREQSGSTGRYAGDGDFGQGDYSGGRRGNSGQDRYGQSGYGGHDREDRRGDHRGKGPKGYQRSDERLKEMVCERLTEDPDIDASDISISIQGGLVTLEGTVDSRRTKYLAEDVVEQFVNDVQNNLRVRRAGVPTLGGGENEQSRSKQH